MQERYLQPQADIQAPKEEDRIDIAEAEKILAQTKEEDWIPFEQAKAELGLYRKR